MGFWEKHQQRQRKKQRELDRKMLFPTIRQQQKSKREGDQAIRTHIRIDRAWKEESEWAHEGIEEDTP